MSRQHVATMVIEHRTIASTLNHWYTLYENDDNIAGGCKYTYVPHLDDAFFPQIIPEGIVLDPLGDWGNFYFPTHLTFKGRRRKQTFWANQTWIINHSYIWHYIEQRSVSSTCLHTALMHTKPMKINFYFINIFSPV